MSKENPSRLSLAMQVLKAKNVLVVFENNDGYFESLVHAVDEKPQVVFYALKKKIGTCVRSWGILKDDYKKSLEQ